MFTGIIETVGRVVESESGKGTRRIRIRATEAFLGDVEVGDSIAIDGACLTPVQIDGEEFTVEAVGTTVSRTIAGGYRVGHAVNLERALSFGGRLDGHLVQGHVDGVGRLVATQGDGGDRLMEFSVPPEVHRLSLVHGSIALNGVSLTLNRLIGEDRVEVAVIPHTWNHTNFAELVPGDPVNVEGDLIGKYVGKLVGGARPGGGAAGDYSGEHPGGAHAL